MEFTFEDLIKRFLKYSWVIALVMILFAGAGFTYAKSGKTITNYAASRSVIAAKDNTNVKDPNSRFTADKSLIATYEKVAQDDAIVSAVKEALPYKLSKSDISAAVVVDNPTDTLLLNFKATGSTPYRAKTLANVYAQVFSEQGPKLFPDMPEISLLSKAAGSDVTRSGFKSAKKLTVFGAVAGVIISSFMILITGIRTNYKSARRG
ncbi:Capsular polysaccharide biosynthesis protein YveK (YveK) [Fructobacillus fructosus]|uniref:capsular biosynthesis protein n=1 Tax=Fructobacillus fructosus TaxID=1631 RepID=UPI002D879E52|nr:Capsular polysaccharide biosynthesis protein YveK (YveK) [Fructobacillus fructosus]